VTRTVNAALAYAALAVLMTWPLARDISTQIAWDLGDPVFNSWVMLWTGGQVLATLSGDLNAIHEFWHGNIFHPASLTIAYSEHLTPQTLQILPLLAATGNIVLCYNLLFLSTFVLSGLGMYLFVRELTGRPWAAFLAGVAFAFAPYRISQYSHLQVLSSQWMPFALLGLHRYFARASAGAAGAHRALAGGAGAMVLQNLSCGYYLLFFPPFAAAYSLYEIARRGLMRNVRVWRDLALAAVVTLAMTWPFLSPYLELRVHGDVGVRSYEEAVIFSADTYSFATASAHSKLWGVSGWRLLAYPKGEGEGFPGFTILAFGAIAVAVAAAGALTRSASSGAARWEKALIALLLVGFAVSAAALLTLFVRGTLPIRVEGRPWRDTDPFLIAVIVLPLIAAATPMGRRFWQGAGGVPVAFAAIAATVAGLLALGPRISSAGRLLGNGPYMVLYNLVPGFDGVRVPARFFMVMALFLAVLAGLGAAAALARSRRLGAVAVLAGVLGMIAESWVVPMPMNVRLAPFGFNLTPRDLEMGEEISPLYRLIRDEPGKVALIEFPFGEAPYEILATFYAGYHRRPLVNGYSGFFPESYLRRRNFLSGIPFDLEAATRSLRSSGATHALVHEAAFTRGRGKEISQWLTSIGAQLVATHGTDKLFLLPR
jgi:hypothetical protein